MTENEIDWRSVAVRLFRADGACYLLTTPERDALEKAHAEFRKPTPDDEAVKAGYEFLRGLQP